MTIDTLRDTMDCPGDTVCAIGRGPIDLMLTHLARLREAWVIVVGQNSLQLEKACEFGADELVSVTAGAFPSIATLRALRRRAATRNSRSPGPT